MKTAVVNGHSSNKLRNGNASKCVDFSAFKMSS